MKEYTAWHIARLRDRLARYRAVETINGRARPWVTVASDIFVTEGLPESYFDSEGSDEVLAEALRRFVDGQQVPKTERLDAISLFLRSKGYFHDEDIQETAGDYAAALALSSFFQSASISPQEITGVFTTSRKEGRAGSRVFTLEIAPTDRAGLQRLLETIEYNPDFVMNERIYMPGRLRTHAGYRKEQLEGWLVRGDKSGLALVQDRLHGSRQVFVVPYGAMTENPDESFLVVMKLAGFAPSEPIQGIGRERATMLIAQVGEWAYANTWNYRLRPPDAERGR
ncbi:hypothetical protein [Hyphomicrobium sp.]|uniref:hypothetical protein n=1 Tax=Hyphomicrobium sp. TaxID=82 RepID=UPI003F6FA69F